MPKPTKPSRARAMNRAAVLVPATTANLGPGFDSLGLALSLSNLVTVARDEPGAEAPEGPDRLDAPFPMAAEAGAAFFRAAGVAPFPFRVGVRGNVPRSRGLGSSVTVRLGVLMGLNALAGSGLKPVELFQLCAALEGHPDNAAPACFGGFALSWEGGAAGFPVRPSLRFAILIPGFEMDTAQARTVLPRKVPREGAVRSAANAARIAAAFATGDYGLLRGAFWDGLHQPYRKRLIPFLDDVIAAGEAAGAYGGFLSGSGSSVCCPAPARAAEAVAAAMRDAAARAGFESEAVVAKADNRGARLAAPGRAGSGG